VLPALETSKSVQNPATVPRGTAVLGRGVPTYSAELGLTKETNPFVQMYTEVYVTP